MSSAIWVNVRDKLGFLAALMKEYASDSTQIIFEGELSAIDFSDIEECELNPGYQVYEGNEVIALKLSKDVVGKILNKIQPGGRYMTSIEYIHLVQGNNTVLVIGDNFHKECISVYPSIQVEFLKGLINKGIIRGYHSDESTKSKHPQFNA